MEHFGISVVIKEDIGVEAETYEEAVEVVKQTYLDQHNIELADHEIDPRGTEEIKDKIIELQDQLIFILTEGVHFGNKRVYDATKAELKKLKEEQSNDT